MVRHKLWPVLRDYALITVGALLIAAAVRVFLVPNDVVSGGVTGVSQILSSFLGTPVGVLVLVLNIPLFVVGFRQLGGFVFGVRTIYATLVMSLAIDLLRPYVPAVTDDPLLYSLYGGLLDGVGMGLVLRARGTTGGWDILARLLERRLGTQPGRSILAFDIAIFAAAFFIYGPERVLYALLVAFVSSRALDFTLAAGTGAFQALIITAEPDGIAAALMNDLQRGVTVLQGTGAFTGTPRAVLLCVVARAEVSSLRAIVAQADPQAFVVIGDASEVLGEGFRPIRP